MFKADLSTEFSKIRLKSYIYDYCPKLLEKQNLLQNWFVLLGKRKSLMFVDLPWSPFKVHSCLSPGSLRNCLFSLLGGKSLLVSDVTLQEWPGIAVITDVDSINLSFIGLY